MMGSDPPFLPGSPDFELLPCHGLFEIFDLDAGFFSRRLFTFVDQNLGYGLVVGLKENQPELLQEAKKILGWTREKNSPELVTPWQRYQGTLMRRKLYRTRDLDGWLDWKNLRQVWLVVQETATPPRGVLARPSPPQTQHLLSVAVEVALQAHRRRAAFSGVSLASPAPESAPFTVVVDPTEITKAFNTPLGRQTHHHRNGQSLALVRLDEQNPKGCLLPGRSQPRTTS
jgi:hypothetical protein